MHIPTLGQVFFLESGTGWKFIPPPKKKNYKSTEKSCIENRLRQTNKSLAGKIPTESFLANTIQLDGGFSITNGYASVSNYPPKKPTAILHPQKLWELQDNLLSFYNGHLFKGDMLNSRNMNFDIDTQHQRRYTAKH